MQHCDCSVPEEQTEKQLGSAQNTFHSDLADQAGFSTLNSLLQTHYLGLAKMCCILVPHLLGNLAFHPKCQITFASFSVLLKFSKW